MNAVVSAYDKATPTRTTARLCDTPRLHFSKTKSLFFQFGSNVGPAPRELPAFETLTHRTRLSSTTAGLSNPGRPHRRSPWSCHSKKATVPHPSHDNEHRGHENAFSNHQATQDSEVGSSEGAYLVNRGVRLSASLLQIDTPSATSMLTVTH